MQIVSITNVAEAEESVRACGERHILFQEVRLHVFRGATLFVLYDSGKPVSYNVTRIGKRRRNIWEPYANCHVLYTVASRRRDGLSYTLARYVDSLAKDLGCRRLKSLAGSLSGLRLHIALGHQIWGITPKREVLVDTPLIDLSEYQGQTPPNIPDTSDTLPWTLDRVLKELNGQSLAHD